MIELEDDAMIEPVEIERGTFKIKRLIDSHDVKGPEADEAKKSHFIDHFLNALDHIVAQRKVQVGSDLKYRDIVTPLRWYQRLCFWKKYWVLS